MQSMHRERGAIQAFMRQVATAKVACTCLHIAQLHKAWLGHRFVRLPEHSLLEKQPHCNACRAAALARS